jgi:hypothetical protein
LRRPSTSIAPLEQPQGICPLDGRLATINNASRGGRTNLTHRRTHSTQHTTVPTLVDAIVARLIALRNPISNSPLHIRAAPTHHGAAAENLRHTTRRPTTVFFGSQQHNSGAAGGVRRRLFLERPYDNDTPGQPRTNTPFRARHSYDTCDGMWSKHPTDGYRHQHTNTRLIHQT